MARDDPQDAPRPPHGSAPEPEPTPATEPAATASRPDYARRTLMIGLGIIAGILLLLIAIWLVLFITKGRFLKPVFEKYASRIAERRIDVAGDFQLYFAPVDVKFVAEGLSVANPRWATRPEFFTAKAIDARFATVPLFFGERRVKWINLDGGRVAAEWDATSKRNSWTFGDPNAPPQPFELPHILRGTISDSRVYYRDPAMQLTADIGFDTIRAKDTRFAEDIRFSGGGTIRERNFTLAGGLLSPNETVSGGRNQLTLTARSSDTVMDVSGTLPAATQIEGANLRVGVRGPNLAQLFDFIGVAVPDTRSYRLRSQLTKVGDEWRFTRLTGMFGESDLGGRMTISMPNERLFINADLASRVVDIVDIGPFIGYDPRRLQAQGGAGVIEQVNGTPRILPDAPLRADAIALFDAKVNYKVARIRAESLPVSNVALTLDLNRSLLKLSPLSFDVSRGHLDADIAINARVRPVVTDYDIRLAPTPMGTLLAGFGVEEAGTSGTVKARIQMKGEGDSVRESLATSDGRIAIILPKGTFWTRNIQLSELDVGTYITKMFEGKLKDPVEINCGLIAFTVRNGVAAADPIIVDTRKNVMLGRGRFSFRDESMDLTYRADSKKFSLFAGQSPIGIGGHFAAPKIDVISPQLLARGGAAVGLGVVASPLASVLAFVDIGDAKSASCGPILSGATAQAQRTTKGKPRDDVGKGR